MWLSVSTIDLVAVRALPPEEAFDKLLLIQNKRNDLKGLNDDGASIPGFQQPASIAGIDPNLTTLVIKRNWSTQAKAQEFADFANTFTEFITVTVEEQP